ncbi:hypothetical protein [Rhizobium sp. C1]|nr:hypothetical protein [Rhizobium sp. C1]MCD2180100.1 hypothetical protein [Rhizobium sp. C1]
MRLKSIALWVLALFLAAVLFYLFYDEMARENGRKVGMAPMLPGLPFRS